ncbi:MAG: hypothetical protein QHH14_13960 [Clostridiales bacterium]|nr:hypothetical protein [Clostridiales bacterium]
MKIRKLIFSGVFLGLFGGIVIGARPFCYPHNQGKKERPKFYAIQVISEKNVQNAKDSLGVPDGHYAEISSGGQLVLLMEKNFIDSGTVVCKGETDYGLEGWFRIQETKDERQNYGWILIQREFCNRFLFFPESYIWFGNTGVNVIRISNVGTKSLFVDAVIGYAMEAEIR